MKYLFFYAMFLVVVFQVRQAIAEDVITDGKVVGISMTTNTIQIRGSQYAFPRISYFDLKNFANAMILDYQNYQNVILDFSQRAGVNPELSKLAREIEERGNQVMAELQLLKGVDLERRYIAAEIELHYKTLDTIDRVFLPSVQNPELRNLVTGIRPNVLNRLDWALRIQAFYGSLGQ